MALEQEPKRVVVIGAGPKIGSNLSLLSQLVIKRTAIDTDENRRNKSDRKRNRKQRW